MSRQLLFAIDLVAISVLTFGLYFPRHRRKDLLAALLGVNIAVLAVADALSSGAVNAGLGLGLFGVLSIIRLRSSELEHEEITYYFAALALGLLGGLSAGPDWLTPTLMAVLLLALFVGDHPRLFARTRHQLMVLDRAFVDETTLTAHLEEVLGATVRRVVVRRVDLVSDTTQVDVRYDINANTSASRPLATIGHPR